MQEIGVGLIGYGLAGRAFHAPYILATPGLALRAVVSSNSAKVHADMQDVTVVVSVEDLLRQPGIDLVVVASPDAFHAEHALAALDAGKHVVVDKPFATSLADARRIADRAIERQLSVSVFQNRRWDADLLTLKRLIAEGALGTIVQFESHFDRWRPTLSTPWKEAREGGSWYDLGPHLVDQAVQLFGMPQAVSADLATLRAGGISPDYFHVILQYPGLRAILHSSKLTAADGLRFAVHGTRGSWIKHGTDVQEAATVAGGRPTGDAWGLDRTEGVLTTDDAQCRPVANERGDYRLFWKALEASLRGAGPNPVPPSEALAVMEILDAGVTSARERREILL